MAARYKDFMIRWGFKATWTLREAVLILNEQDPDVSKKTVFNAEGSEPVDVLYYWFLKQRRQGYVGPVDETKPERFTPGDLIRLVKAHGKNHSENVARIWQVATSGRNSSRILTDMSWAIYLKAKDAIVKKYPTVTKERVAKALSDLPKHYHFPGGTQLMPYSYKTLLRKLKGEVANTKPGRPSKGQLLDIDISQIAEGIRL